MSRTNVHFLVFHLTLADVVICFITMPLETVWRVVVQVSRVISVITMTPKTVWRVIVIIIVSVNVIDIVIVIVIIIIIVWSSKGGQNIVNWTV